MLPIPTPLPTVVLAQARALYPHTAAKRIYLNHAATGPLSVRVTDAIKGYLAERSSGVINPHRIELDSIQECRSVVQRLVNAESAERIAFLANTSEAINVVASGLQWKTGDQILLNDMEFPANVRPYYHLKKHGVEIRFIRNERGKISPGAIRSALSPRTRLVGLSAVQFLSGYRADLRAIGSVCRERNIWFVVDGIQAAGAVEIDVQAMHIDALAVGAQKWLMGPQGVAFLYLTESLQNAVDPRYIGWLSVKDPWQFYDYEQPLASSARRYEGGTPNTAGLIGLRAAVQTLSDFGMAAIESHILALTRQLMDLLRTIDAVTIISPEADAERAGIVTIQSKKGLDFGPVLEELDRQNINISLREGKLRFSPHYYNSPEEIRDTIEALRQALLTTKGI
jgi:cysteine desulfurase/selenocysteine lyase